MQIRRLIWATGIAASVACLPLLGATGAIVSSTSKGLAVNGQPVTVGSAIVAGDLVSTSALGSARMVLPGGSVIAARATSFRMENVNHASTIRLNQGLVMVTGSLPVALNARTVVPASAQSRFNVYTMSGKAVVSALAGSVAVKSARGSYTVHAGESVSFADPTAPQASTSGGAGGGGGIGVATIAVVGTVAVISAVAIHDVRANPNNFVPQISTSPSQ